MRQEILHLDAGVHRVDPDDYHADLLRGAPTLSSTLARCLLDRSPLHAWTGHPRLNPGYGAKEKKVFDLGRAIHRATLGHGSDYVAYPEDVLASDGAASTKAAKDWAREQREAGRIPLKAAEVDMIGAVSGAVRARLAAMGMAPDPEWCELTALAEVDGVWCRAMIDAAPPRRSYLLDLKSCEDASPEACIRAVTAYGLDVQAAFYLDAWEAATGERRRFRFAFVEKSPPHEVSVVELHDRPGDEADWIEDAHAKARHARRLWADCLTSGAWPGYPAQVAIVGAPGFYRARWAALGTNDWTEPAKPSEAALRAAYAAQAPEGVSP